MNCRTCTDYKTFYKKKMFKEFQFVLKHSMMASIYKTGTNIASGYLCY